MSERFNAFKYVAATSAELFGAKGPQVENPNLTQPLPSTAASSPQETHQAESYIPRYAKGHDEPRRNHQTTDGSHQKVIARQAERRAADRRRRSTRPGKDY